MGSKTFLLIVLAIFLVITSEVAARKLAQNTITSLGKGAASEANDAKFLGLFPGIGGLLPNPGGGGLIPGTEGGGGGGPLPGTRGGGGGLLPRTGGGLPRVGGPP